MKPQLDYVIGRPVESVDVGDEGWDWSIRFTGDIILRNHDKRRTRAPEIMGMVFFNQVLSETDTVLNFGHYDQTTAPVIDEEVKFTATEYSITDPRFPDHEEHFPQRPDPEEDITRMPPEDPSPERVADEPDEEWYQEQQRQAQEAAENDSEATE